MNEKDKLEEAKYFLKRMIEEESKSKYFLFNLSAFLSASRSILQYSLEEARGITNGQRWYDSAMEASKILRYFAIKRNISVHEKLVKTKAITKIHIGEHVQVKDVGQLKMSGEPTPTETPQSDLTNDDGKKPSPLSTSETKYFFHDWEGDQDVITLSRTYIDELEKLILDGIKKNFISG